MLHIKSVYVSVVLLFLGHRNASDAAKNLARLNIPHSFQMPVNKPAETEDHKELLNLNDDSISISSPSILRSPECFSEGRFSDENDCGSFYECTKNKENDDLTANKRSCFGNAFDASIQTCVPTYKVKGCFPDQYASLRSSDIEYPGHQKLCLKYSDNYTCYDCKTLLACVGYKPYRIPCEDGRACRMNKEGFTGGVCYPEFPTECSCTKEDTLKKDLYDSTKYLNCTTGSVDPVVESCPVGSIFNNENQECVKLTNSCLKSGRGTFTASNNCARYYTCSLTSNGWIKNWFTCPGYELFNHESHKCENPCEWQYGNFTCESEGRFSNPISCSTYYKCFKESSDSETLLQVESVCPEGTEWAQDEGICMPIGTSKTKCVPMTPKPTTCNIPTVMCRSIALAVCVNDYKFCECGADIEASPAKCIPCDEGHVSNATGCFPLCSKLNCGTSEVCHDNDGSEPGTCSCAPGFSREGELCKDICKDAKGVMIGDQCLIFNNNMTTWVGAVMACAAEGQELASLHNIPAVRDYLTSIQAQWYWFVACSDEISEDKWIWGDGRPLGAQEPWAPREPSAGLKEKNCLAIFGIGENRGLHSFQCAGNHAHYICSMDTLQHQSASEESKKSLVRLGMPSKHCPDDTFRVNDECFFMPNEDVKTWDEAQELCKRQQGFLAEPNSIVDLLDALKKKSAGYNFWIGEVKQKDAQNWRRSPEKSMNDQSSLLTIGESTYKKCPLIMKNEPLPLYMRKCDDHHIFVCEKQ